jgi:hypothetical protein
MFWSGLSLLQFVVSTAPLLGLAGFCSTGGSMVGVVMEPPRVLSEAKFVS